MLPGCSEIQLFQKLDWRNPPSAIRLVSKDPKGFRQSLGGPFNSHFRFDHFHSVLTSQVFVRKSEGWVKIYNVKMIKTGMARGPPKLCRNQKSFWILSTYKVKPYGWCVLGFANLISENIEFINTLVFLWIYLVVLRNAGGEGWFIFILIGARSTIRSTNHFQIPQLSSANSTPRLMVAKASSKQLIITQSPKNNW